MSVPPQVPKKKTWKLILHSADKNKIAKKFITLGYKKLFPVTNLL